MCILFSLRWSWSIYRNTTGVTYRVSVCEKSSPPTTARPSGRRDSAPAPKPSAIGRVPEQSGHRRHHDRTEPDDAGLGRWHLSGRSGGRALRVQGKVDHHDAVLLHEPDEQDDAHEGVHVQVRTEEQQGKQGAEPGKRQRRKDRQRMDETLVQDAEDDIDHENGGDQQQDPRPCMDD